MRLRLEPQFTLVATVICGGAIVIAVVVVDERLGFSIVVVDFDALMLNVVYYLSCVL